MTIKEKWEDAGCPKCGSTHYEIRSVDEVGGMAVGPYDIIECEDCMYADYDHS